MNSQLTNELLAFEADHVWVSENMEMLLEENPDQWIAVKDGKVIASDPEMAGLLSKLRDPAHTSVELIFDQHTSNLIKQSKVNSIIQGGGDFLWMRPLTGLQKQT